jgi:hypothetical protein
MCAISMHKLLSSMSATAQAISKVLWINRSHATS